MPSPLAFLPIFFHSLLSIFLAQAAQSLQTTTPQSTAVTGILRVHIAESELCCIVTNAVDAVYPREARLANIQGVVKLMMVIAKDGSVADVQAVSGDPLLLDAASKAVRQWRFLPSLVNGNPVEADSLLSFTFHIENPPKPAYLHLVNGKVIRADEVREFTDRMEYTVDHRTHRISPNLVTGINACARISVTLFPNEGACIAGGGPSLLVHAIPLQSAGLAKDSRQNPHP